MSTTVDQRVVEMRFDNKHFENNVQTSMSSLDKLKQSLNLTGASKGLENVSVAANNCNMSGLTGAVETVRAKFTALEVMAVTALANITNSALNAGKKIVSALTLDPIKTGFQEYETQINAIQTILANTSAKGTNLEQVTAALNELNSYADKTIYNFTEMTRNIGTFTAAGVDLDTSVQAIKGIANLAAVSGSTSQQASTAMYQLSQALSSGTVKLMDWNSVVNAGMGGQVFQDSLKETARLHGVAIDDMIESEGSFRETLKDGWLTSDILTETLAKFTGDLNEDQLRTMGYTEEQIKSIVKMGQTANDAATKVKTFTQLFDTLKEAAQSGWTKSWEIIVGDFEEAKKLLTDVSNTFGALIGASADARNEMLQGWKDLGGRTALIEAVKNAFEGIMGVVTPLRDAFKDIFPPMTAEQLYNITNGLKELTSHLKISETTSDNLKRTFKGLFAVLDIVKLAFTAVFKAIVPLFGGVGDLAGGILSVTANWGDWLVKLRDTIETTGIFNNVMQGVVSFIKVAKDAVGDFIQTVKEKIVFPGFELLHSFLERVHERMSGVGEAAGKMTSGVTTAVDAMGSALSKSNFLQVLESLWTGMTTIIGGIIRLLGELGRGIAKVFSDINFNSVFDIISGLSLGGITIAITKFLKSVREPLEGFTDILDGVRGCFEAYQTQLKAGALLKIAGAIAILTASILVISLIDSNKLAASLGAITVLFADLMGSMALFGKISGNLTGVFKTCTAMISVSVAVLILASALKKIGELNFGEMVTGLVGVVGLTATMVAAAKIMGSGSSTMIKGATQMVAFAAAIKILASACTDLSKLDWNQLATGLAGVGILLSEVALFMNFAKFSGKAITTATGIVILASAIKILASACSDFGKMKWENIGKGLTAIGVLLGEITLFTNLTGNAKHVISTGIALIAIGAAMKILASALKDFGTMPWGEIGRGLTAMAGALLAVTLAVNFMPKNMVGTGAGLVAVSTALVILATALDKMGDMQWDEIARGLTVLGGSMAILAIGLNVMTGTLAGSAAMLIAAAALAVLTPVLSILGAMSWEAIAKGLVSIAGAFTIIGVAGLVLTPLVPTILALGGAFALIGVGALGIGAGLLAAGAGLSALSIGFTALATAGVAGATAVVASLTIIITGVASLIPVVIAKIGEGIIELCKVIANGAPAIGEAVKAIILSLVNVLVQCVPAIADGALELIAGVLASLVKYTPQIVDSIFQFLIGILDGVARNLPGLIKAAIDVLMSFFSGIVDSLSGIDVGVLIKGIAGIGLLAGIMAALSAVAVLVPGAMLGVLGIVGVFGQLPKIGTDLSTFMQNAQPFIDGIKKVDSSAMEGVRTLAETIVLLTAGNILSGLTSWFTGGSSIVKFGKELAAFAPFFNSYYQSVKGIDGSVVEASANAAKALSELSNNLPNNGGIVSWFTGDNDIASFGAKLVSFGQSFASYYACVSTINCGQLSSIVVEFKKLVELANGISGVDTSKMTSFSQGLTALGNSGVEGFISAFTNANERVTTAATTMLSTFVNGVNAQKTSLTTAFTTLVQAVLTAINGKQAEFQTSGQTLMVKFIAGVRSQDANSRSTFINIISGCLAYFKNKYYEFQSVGRECMTRFAWGVNAGSSSASSSFSSCVSGAISLIGSYYGQFYSIGSYLVQGFASGISANTYLAVARAEAMAWAAANAARARLQIRSPSKVFYEIGNYAGMAFVNALSSYESKSYQAGTDMADSARNGLSSVMSTIADAISCDFDMQPRIRPVLDLSNIKSGANDLYRTMGNFSGYALSGSVDIANRTSQSISQINSRQNENLTAPVLAGLEKSVKALSENRQQVFKNTFHITGNNPKEIATEVSRIIQQQVERKDLSWA